MLDLCIRWQQMLYLRGIEALPGAGAGHDGLI